MAEPGQIDHVQAGLADVPEKLRAPRVDAYLSVYLEQFNTIEALAQSVLSAYVQWRVAGQQYDFVLETIGALLGQPRPDGFDNVAYAFILQARVLARRSTATRDDVRRVADFLARNKQAFVFGIAPKIISVVFVDLVLTPQELSLYEQILLSSIDAVDALQVTQVTSATAFYDVGKYDEELYAP